MGDETPESGGDVAQVALTPPPESMLIADWSSPVLEFLDRGGVVIWIIAALSVITLTIILWKLWRFWAMGVWRRQSAKDALRAWLAHQDAMALAAADARPGIRADLAKTAIANLSHSGRSEDAAREDVARVAKAHLAEARSGLRLLEVIATLAPLLGLLGTVLGMIAAFQQLQATGSRADPSALAGGIWEALLTTAAGMAVAIPASAALSWFESTVDRLRLDMEDIATRIFTRPRLETLAHAAE